MSTYIPPDIEKLMRERDQESMGPAFWVLAGIGFGCFVGWALWR
jgi:hypothetical protein